MDHLHHTAIKAPVRYDVPASTLVLHELYEWVRVLNAVPATGLPLEGHARRQKPQTRARTGTVSSAPSEAAATGRNFRR